MAPVPVANPIAVATPAEADEALPLLPGEAPAEAAPAPAPVAARPRRSFPTRCPWPRPRCRRKPRPPWPRARPTMPPTPPLPDEAPASTPAAMPTPAAPAPSMPVSPSQIFAAPIDDAVTQVGCPSCGQSVRANAQGWGQCGSCGRSGQCVPGRKNCGGGAGAPNTSAVGSSATFTSASAAPTPATSRVGFPRRTPLLPGLRPSSDDHPVPLGPRLQMRFPDRNEFFWARQGSSGGGGRGPAFPPKGFSNVNSRARRGSGQAG